MRSAWLVVIGFLTVVAVPAVHAQKPERLAVGYGSISTNYLPLWMAKEAGIFRKNGLDVDTVFFTSSPTAFMALLAGETAITINPGPDVVNAHLAGADVVCCGWNCSPRLVETASQSILAFRHTGGRRYPSWRRHITKSLHQHRFQHHPPNLDSGFRRNDGRVTAGKPVTPVIHCAQAAKGFIRMKSYSFFSASFVPLRLAAADA